MKKPFFPPNWAVTRQKGRELYAYKYGACFWGIPMLLFITCYEAYSQHNIYGFLGSMFAAIPLVPWAGYRIMAKQFDRYERAFLAAGEAAFSPEPVQPRKPRRSFKQVMKDWFL